MASSEEIDVDQAKTIIVTGASSGLGFECARRIAQRPGAYRVVLACRSKEKADRAKREIAQVSGNPRIGAMELDVSSLASVRSFAKRFKEENTTGLAGIVCNAGVSGTARGATSEGFDIVFATNHLGHYLLTLLLLPVMEQAGRILVVSSDMHCPPQGDLVWPGADALAHPAERLADSPLRYSYSKLCNLYFTYELAARLEACGSSITANAFNPGLMTETNFTPDKARFSPAFLESVSDRLGSLDASSSALAVLALDARFAGETGEYFDRGTSAAASSSLSYDRANARELWDASARFAGVDPAEALSDGKGSLRTP